MTPEERRTHFRQGLHYLYAPLYDKLCEALGPEWEPVSGLRTFEQQAELYRHGRTDYGPLVTKAAPGLSFHNYGLASDWDYFGPTGMVYSPLTSDDPKWSIYQTACIQLGLRLISWERPHNELAIQTPVRALYSAYQASGMVAVNDLLQKEILDGPTRQ